MTVIVIAAVFCAACTIYLVFPIAQTHRRTTHTLMIALPTLALAIYMALGTPDMPGAGALFEREGPRAESRAAVKDELTAMEALSKDPDNAALMLEIGSLQLSSGRTQDAIKILERARELEPKNNDIRLQLGAAYFVSGLDAAQQNEKEKARENFKKAQKTAPKDAPYLGDLKKIIKEF